MSIKIIDAPDDIGLARNQVWFNLLTDNHLLQAGSNASMQIVFSAQPQDGGQMYLKIAYEDGSLAAIFFITARSSPSSIDEFEVNNAGLSSWISNTFAPFLRNHYQISSLFSVTEAANSVTLTMRDAGEILSHYSSFNNSTITVNNTVQAPLFRPNFEIGVRLFIWNKSYYELIDTSHYQPDINGNILFNIADILLAHLGHDLPVSSFSYIAENIIRKYYIQFYEFYGQPASIRNSSTMPPKKALYAGIPYHLFPNNDFIDDYIYTQKNFLTWKPYDRSVTPDQEEFLYYLFPFSSSNPDTYVVGANVVYNDGTSTFSNLYEITSWTFENVAILPIGYNDNNIASINSNKTPVRYDITVGYKSNIGTISISPKIRCHLDQLPYQHKQQFFFVNSLGGVDTLLCKGPQTHNLDVQGESARQITQRFYNSHDAQTFNYNKVAKKTFTARTGYLTQQEVEWLQDLLINFEYCYTYLDNHQVAVNIIPDSHELYNENNDMVGLSFEYELAFDYNAYGRKW